MLNAVPGLSALFGQETPDTRENGATDVKSFLALTMEKLLSQAPLAVSPLMDALLNIAVIEYVKKRKALVPGRQWDPRNDLHHEAPRVPIATEVKFPSE